MVTPLTKSDDFHQIPIEQKPNTVASSSVRPCDLHLEKPTLTVLVPSKSQGLKLMSMLKSENVEIDYTTSAETMMQNVQQPDIARKQEPKKPRSTDNIVQESTAFVGVMKTGSKNNGMRTPEKR
ncbi:hypothetical protein SEMRO_149_G068630.1 [Seminavis robusta]|uniref:Uncharacterized protein n=1 Tax=Seminavis robusta TaxID=568900 RepID=A0A9N8DN93_9STRA|nr:hypothetical protein SEMRO_149_G068630.1 [Seminavis robusta]|eukprot:Sro149_g068630.1 n/a (124) ;mRNA; r:83893-84346